MPHSREAVIAAIGAVFPAADVERLLALVDGYGTQPYERERERVQLAILNLCRGDEEKLRYFLKVAKQDYRDVLFWSDNPEQAVIDTPEKKQQVRELLDQLSGKPPTRLGN